LTDSYYFFWNGPFSQWHTSNFELSGHSYLCAEQYMMHQKAVLFDDKIMANKILASNDPGKQKAFGKQVQGFEEEIWRQNRERIVAEANRAKYFQNKGLRRKLFQTGNALLVEASPIDTIWGIGLSAEEAKRVAPAAWPGQNLLGKILTTVRGQLRLEFSGETGANQPSEYSWQYEGPN
jgi:ribA/ribD-fused uncharacterized protein